MRTDRVLDENGDLCAGSAKSVPRYHFDRHGPDHRDRFLDITQEMHGACPPAWTDTYDGHWVAAGSDAVFELARCPYVSNDQGPARPITALKAAARIGETA
ncbi:hypothetical protein [Mycobacterium sp. ITM-2016-00317]|uniref:hypothetical protein n=1 Tax=Mycobacterium sp. ITM-2016-00317 TaxID=2099694 RepID=UPI0037CADF14